MRSGVIRAAALVLPVIQLVACAPSPSATTVDVTVHEWAIVPDEVPASPGEVTFVVTNDGPAQVHEFVIIRTDLDPADLPTDATGAVNEAGEDIEVVDKIADIAVGDTAEVTVTLEAGNYVLICNIYDETTHEAHYAMGMRASFTVD